MMSRNTISKVRILSLILALAMIFLTPMTMAANPQDPPPAPLEAVSDALEPEHAAGEPEALPAEELSEESTFLGEEETSSEPAESFTLPSEPETAWETADPAAGIETETAWEAVEEQPGVWEEETTEAPSIAPMGLSPEFWIENTSGNRVYEAVLRPGQSIKLGLHNWMTFALSSHATWKVSPGSGRGTLSTSTGAECTYTAGSVTGTATVTATLKDGTSNSIKIYITKTLDIIRPDTNVDVPYEHIYVGAAKQLRGNTVENREYNTDLKAYWTTGGHDDLVRRAWDSSQKCWTTQTITGLKPGTFTLALKATTQNDVQAQIPVTVIQPLSPNRLGFVTSAQKLRIASPTSLSATSVYRGAAVTIKGQVGNYWYVTFGSAWGFLPKSVVNDYPYGTYSGPSSKYYFMNRDKYVKVTSFKSGTARDPNEYKKNIFDFWSKYNDADRKAKYQSIADQTDLPIILIAAIHYREKGGNLNYSFRDGSNLNGKDFVADAVKTIKSGQWRDFQNAIGMGKGTRNLLAMLQFAELWNGTGCADFGRINPYLYAGTNIYSKGKYPYDGHWDPEWEDGQPGVLYLLTQVY